MVYQPSDTEIEEAAKTFEAVLDWTESSADYKDMVKEPHVRVLLSFIIAKYTSPDGYASIINADGMKALTMVAQASYMMGYKRSLDTTSLDKNWGDKP